jgi:hypothetical protein
MFFKNPEHWCSCAKSTIRTDIFCQKYYVLLQVVWKRTGDGSDTTRWATRGAILGAREGYGRGLLQWRDLRWWFRRGLPSCTDDGRRDRVCPGPTSCGAEAIAEDEARWEVCSRDLRPGKRVLPTEIPPFRYTRTSPSRFSAAVTAVVDPTTEHGGDEGVGIWYLIKCGKEVRIGDSKPWGNPSRYRSRTIWRATPEPNWLPVGDSVFDSGKITGNSRDDNTVFFQGFSFSFELQAVVQNHQARWEKSTVMG